MENELRLYIISTNGTRPFIYQPMEHGFTHINQWNTALHISTNGTNLTYINRWKTAITTNGKRLLNITTNETRLYIDRQWITTQHISTIGRLRNKQQLGSEKSEIRFYDFET